MCAELINLSHLAVASGDDRQIAVHQGKKVYRSSFVSDVYATVNYISTIQSQKIALYYQDAYPFCVGLYAILHSGKNAWVPGNNRVATANKLKQQQCVLMGNWPENECDIGMVSESCNATNNNLLTPLNIDHKRLILFTSGSSGEAKTISKTLRQLQNEIEVLQKHWGQLLTQEAHVLSTVSHQHIYGLLFRLLWPMAAGRIFTSELFLSPEALLKCTDKRKAYWVASPAQLKRLDQQTAWQDITNLVAIFSSGGALAIESATQIYTHTQHKVIEVYGSSETGGIAWRQSVDNMLWTVFKEVSFVRDREGSVQLFSPFLQEECIMLDDNIEINSNGQFALLGRLDRIVKVEEKRLSLNALENCLNQLEWVGQSHTQLLTHIKRETVGAALALNESGKDFLDQQGKPELIKQIRQQLMLSFETVVIPRRWMFMTQLPLTVQSKIDQYLLKQLLSLDSRRLPNVQSIDLHMNYVNLQLKAQESLIYFNGHFPGQPILPGITQLAWVEFFGKLFFNINEPFLRMEVIKFKKIIRPDSFIRMELNWKIETGKLYFYLRSDDDSFSSGRMVYGEH